MKITLFSDLHLEFDPHFRPVNPGSDILFLAGDICVVEPLVKLAKASTYMDKNEKRKYDLAKNFHEFFKHVCSEWEHVFYIPGNHEYYKGFIEDGISELRQHLAFENLTIFDTEYTDYKGYRIIGSTLWTNLNNGCPLTEMYLKNGMNDYHLILSKTKNYRKLNPLDTFKLHNEYLKKIDEYSMDHANVLVMTHHAPSPQSVHDQYKHDRYMNGGYYSDLEEFILERPQIKCWVHGHTHSTFAYNVGETKVICNPKGYRDENPDFNSELIVEV